MTFGINKLQKTLFLYSMIVACNVCVADIAIRPCWSKYIANGKLPIYSGFEAAGNISDFAQVSGNILRLNSLGENTYGWYRFDCSDGLDFEKGVTIQFRARLLCSEGGGTAAIKITSRQQTVTIDLQPDKLNVINLGSFSIDTSQFHDYHISIKTGEDNLKLYVDSNPYPVMTLTVPSIVPDDPNNIIFGDLTATADADWEISNISWTNLGAFEPGFSGIEADYDYNCKIDIIDYAILAQKWILTEIDFEQVSSFASNYLEKADDSAVYITDLAQSQPTDSLSKTNSSAKWMVLPYETAQFKGRMLGSFSFNYLDNIVIPLHSSGWHDVYIGYWNPNFASDGTFGLKFKLSDDNAFFEIHEPTSQDTQQESYIREVFAMSAELTGQSLIIGKPNGVLAKRMFVAYIKLVPLSEQQINDIQIDRAQVQTRNSIAMLDTKDLFESISISSADDIRNIIEPYRHSDIKTVMITAGYGDKTIHNSDIQDVVWLADLPRSEILSQIDDIGHNIAAGQKQLAMTLRSLEDKNTPFEQIVCETAQSLGLNFELRFNLAMQGGMPSWWGYDPNSFVNKNEEFWQTNENGEKVSRASYAFAEVRDFFVSMIEETLLRTEADGVSLCFDKGPPFIQNETPFINRFRDRYGINPRGLSPDDPRIGEIKCEFMTTLVTQIREMMDQIELQNSKQLDLSIWTWGSDELHANGMTPKQEGIDVENWLDTGLLDALFCSKVDTYYQAKCENNSCVFAVVLSSDLVTSSPPVIVNQAYNQGVGSFVFDFIHKKQFIPENWIWMKRIGHVSEIFNWEEFAPIQKKIKLNKLKETDVLQGLGQAVFSGG